MQHTVAKHFIYCKHNITIPHTQVIPQKVVTFFENLKSWSHTSLFVWDWNCRARRIASDFTRFYRIAKCVTHRIWLDYHPKTQYRTNIEENFGAKQQVSLCQRGFRGNVNTDSRKKDSCLTVLFSVNPPGLQCFPVAYKLSNSYACFVICTHTTLTETT